MPRARTLKRDEDRTDINISPMIDMVFILLIFFIVTTVFVEEQGLDADKPQPSVAPQAENLAPVKLRLTSTGQVLINSGENNALIDISLSTVRSRVAERLREGPDLSVIMEVEKDVPTGRMIQVIDEAKVGGAPKVSVTNAQ